MSMLRVDHLFKDTGANPGWRSQFRCRGSRLFVPGGSAWALGDFVLMALNTDSALDNLARLVRVIGPDQQLRQWFSALGQKPEVERRNAIYSMSEQMRADGKDEDLVVSFRLLADARVFEAARLALQEYD